MLGASHVASLRMLLAAQGGAGTGGTPRARGSTPASSRDRMVRRGRVVGVPGTEVGVRAEDLYHDAE